MHTLDWLFGALGARAPTLPVRGIACDSRRVEPGMIFVALQGRARDGHDFIADAVDRGAVAAVGERAEAELRHSTRVPYLQVPNARRALSHLAAAYYDYPASHLFVIGVTGTKGKTTTCALTHHILQADDHPAGLLCTVGLWNGWERITPRGHATTPEAPVLQATLAEWVTRGLGHAVLETSSHALALHRVDDIAYDLAIWTTLHPEHLDFHGDMEHYFRAKASLVERAPFAILNADCPYSMRLSDRPHLSYGIDNDGDLRATEIVEGPHSVRFTLQAPSFHGRVEIPGIGRFNVFNALAALAAAHYIGMPLREVVPSIADFQGVPGRMQIIQCLPTRVVVDFAHTPESLALALDALRHATRGRLLLLTGAAGGRDPNKRLPIGRLAVERADLTVFTEEDYEDEPLDSILGTIERGARAAGGRPGRDYFVIRSRPAAIHFLLRAARPGDTVLLAGKGHEHYLTRNGHEMPWDEAAEARRWL